MINTDNTDKKQQSHKFIKGQSGNPNGRPKGSLNKATNIIKKIFESDIEKISQKIVKMAQEGDIQAMKIIIERLFAPRKENYLNFDISLINNSSSLVRAGNDIVKAISESQLTISEGKELFLMLESIRKNIETENLEKRLKKLETQI